MSAFQVKVLPLLPDQYVELHIITDRLVTLYKLFIQLVKLSHANNFMGLLWPITSYGQSDVRN